MGSLREQGLEGELGSVAGVDGLHKQLKQRAGARPYCYERRQILPPAQQRASGCRSASGRALSRPGPRRSAQECKRGMAERRDPKTTSRHRALFGIFVWGDAFRSADHSAPD